MEIKDVRKVLCVGSGFMGRQIALQCARYGYNVSLYGRSRDKLNRALTQIKQWGKRLGELGLITADKLEEAIKRIQFTDDAVLAASEADLLSESVLEDPEVKKEVFSKFHELCPPRTVFTTNTSSFIPSMFAEASGRPEIFAAYHFHSYVWNSPVVEIMPHPGTTAETVKLLNSFSVKIGQIPIHIKTERNNYIFNSLMSALNTAALKLVTDGIADFHVIDRAWRGVMKMPMGPFGFMDHIGLDTLWKMNDYWAGETDDRGLKKNADYLKAFIDRGDLGVKSGQGFYKYPEPLW